MKCFESLVQTCLAAAARAALSLSWLIAASLLIFCTLTGVTGGLCLGELVGVVLTGEVNWVMLVCFVGEATAAAAALERGEGTVRDGVS